MVAKCRALRLAGYEIYRFGEKAVLSEFFDRFLE
jgi:hypothetical protein